jgi:ABC-2 type transport system permease protein
MKQFLSFVRKEFYHIFRDKRTLLLLFMIPIVQMLLIGFCLTTEVKNTKMAVYDPSKDISTERIIRKLDANQYFTLVKYLNSPDQIQKVMQESKASLVVVFSENFHDNVLHTGEATVQLIADATDPNQARAFTAYAASVIQDYGQELMREAKIPLQILPEVRMLYNPQMKGAYNFVPGVIGMILMLICAMMTSISIVREKERGTMEVLLTSPVKPIYIILSKVTPYFVLAIADLAIILLTAVFVLDVPVAGSLLLLVSMALLFILAALSLGLLISNIVSSQVAAMLISGMGLILPTILLSGLAFPIESMPGILQWISAVLPVRWFIQAVRKVMIQGVDIVFITKELIILTAMIALLLFMSLRTFKIRLKK